MGRGGSTAVKGIGGLEGRATTNAKRPVRYVLAGCVSRLHTFLRPCVALSLSSLPLVAQSSPVPLGTAPITESRAAGKQSHQQRLGLRGYVLTVCSDLGGSYEGSSPVGVTLTMLGRCKFDNPRQIRRRNTFTLSGQGPPLITLQLSSRIILKRRSHEKRPVLPPIPGA